MWASFETDLLMKLVVRFVATQTSSRLMVVVVVDCSRVKETCERKQKQMYLTDRAACRTDASETRQAKIEQRLLEIRLEEAANACESG